MKFISKKSQFKKILLILSVIFYLAGITSCAKNSSATSKTARELNPRQGVYYSLFVRSFADSDKDGIGDFNGITQKLDYLSQLGISGIWLLPIYPSHSYHGYDVDNYYMVNPDYGSMEDFENLVKVCNERGIAVMLDITFNHSSSNNEWFTASKNPEDPHRAWYHWISENPVNENTGNVKDYSLNQQIWGHALWNKAGNSYYAGEFYEGMPDFNLDCPELRKELKNVLKFWTDKGVSGFRFDAAGHIYDKIKMPNGFITSTESANEFWKEITDYLEEINPQNYSVGEVWDHTNIRAQALGGLNSVFHFDMGDVYILERIKQNDDGNNIYAQVIYNDLLAYSRQNPDYIDAPFLSNHDQSRIAGLLKGNTEELKLAAGMYILTQGIPFVYYGEEIGMMSGTKDETKRTPFLWGGNDKYQTSWANEQDCIYNKKTKSLKEQLKDKNSLTNYYINLINFRNSCSAFNGKFEVFDVNNSAVSSWIMKDEKQSALVLNNVSAGDTTVSVDLPVNFPPDFSTNEVKKNKDGTITIPPLTTAVFCF